MNAFRRYGVTLVALAVLGILSACGQNTPISAGPGAQPTKAASDDGPAVKTDKNGTHWCENVQASDFNQTGPYTAEQVADAYCQMITFNGEMYYSSFAVDKKNGEKWRDYEDEPFRKWFTTNAWKRAHQSYLNAIEDDPENPGGTKEAQSVLVAFDMESDEYHFDPDAPYVTKQRWSPAEYWADGQKDKQSGATRIGMKIRFDDTLLLVKPDKRRVTVPFERNTTYYLSPSGGDGTGRNAWLIDGWEVDWKFGAEQPRK